MNPGIRGVPFVAGAGAVAAGAAEEVAASAASISSSVAFANISHLLCDASRAASCRSAFSLAGERPSCAASCPRRPAMRVTWSVIAFGLPRSSIGSA